MCLLFDPDKVRFTWKRGGERECKCTVIALLRVQIHVIGGSADWLIMGVIALSIKQSNNSISLHLLELFSL